MKPERSPDWDWVTARHACSIQNFFERLQLGAQSNVETRNKLAEKEGSGVKCSVASHGNSFSVLRDLGFGERAAVRFNCTNDRIVVDGFKVPVHFEGTLTLNNEGQCRLQVAVEVLDEWQVLRMAIEPLLFLSQI